MGLPLYAKSVPSHAPVPFSVPVVPAIQEAKVRGLLEFKSSKSPVNIKRLYLRNINKAKGLGTLLPSTSGFTNPGGVIHKGQ